MTTASKALLELTCDSLNAEIEALADRLYAVGFRADAQVPLPESFVPFTALAYGKVSGRYILYLVRPWKSEAQAVPLTGASIQHRVEAAQHVAPLIQKLADEHDHVLRQVVRARDYLREVATTATLVGGVPKWETWSAAPEAKPANGMDGTEGHEP